jgi:hypothetical protein
MFLVSFLFLFVPLRDQMNCCTRVAYEKDKRYSWLLRLEGKPYDTIVFRVNMYTFMTGLFCIALCTYFLCWDVVTNLSPANH